MYARTHIAKQHIAAVHLGSAAFGSIQRVCGCAKGNSEAAESYQGRIERPSANGRDPGSVPPLVHQVLQSSGTPLDSSTRGFFERRFGHAFGNVRVHADAQAGESARAVNALAYTVGNDVVFAAGMYAPHTSAGRELLAHELTHTLQQDAGSGSWGQHDGLTLGDPGDAAEREAEAAARAVLQPGRATRHPFLSAPRFPKGTEARTTIAAGSLSEAGSHPSSEIIEGCGEKPAAAKGGSATSVSAGTRAVGKVIRRKATFTAGNPREERNAAELIVTGGPAGVTLPMLNGKIIRNTADAEGAVKEPEIESTPKKGGGVQCRVKTVAENAGSYDESVLSAGPWVFQTPRANVPRSLGLTPCRGEGDTTVTAHGKPSDADVAKANRTHEDHHATDDEQAFKDTVGKWDEKLTQAEKDKRVFEGESAAKCETAIYAATDGTPKSVAGRYWGSVDAAGKAFHRTAGGGTLGISSATVDPGCAHVDIDVHT